MKTIKIIDIVKLIEKKNYKNLPKKIKINNKTYEFDKTDNEYRRYDRGGSFTPLYEFMKNGGIEYFSELIQMEAEIIEEEKEIEKLDIDKNDISYCEGNMKTDEDMVDIFLETKDKINELIDAVNSINKGK